MPDDRSADVVEFWRSVELFGIQTVPPRARVGPDRSPSTYEIVGQGPLPWQEGHPAARANPGKDREWRYVVYAGLFDVQRVQQEMVRALGGERLGGERGLGGESALFAFTVGADGYLVEDSAVLSSGAWALGRLREPGPAAANWLDGFEREERAFAAALNRLAARPVRTGPTESVPTADGSTTPGKDPDTTGARVARAVGRHVGGAATDALNEGAKTLGGMVGGVASAAVTGVAGPLVGGYAGSVAGTFATKLLTIRRSGADVEPPADGASGNDDAPSRAAPPPATRMTGAYLTAFVEELARALHVEESLRPSGIRITIESVPIRREDNPRTGASAMLNSFIRADLDRIADELRRGNVGPALQQYLTPDAEIDTSERTDTAADRAAVLAQVEPKRRPSGRWPVGREQPLAIGQQLAVDRILAELGDGAGVSTVNGPPGTGKTTLLREIVAAVIVRRAGRLAELATPQEAFDGGLSYTDGGQSWTLKTLRQDLAGDEIVLATNSNSAAQNVTHELPSASAADISRLEGIGHFPEIATELLGKPAWALVSAALGNFTNRRRFVDVAWWPKKSEPVPGLLARLKLAADDPAPYLEEWSAAVVGFRAVRNRVRELTSERQVAAEACRRHQAYPERREVFAARERRGRDELTGAERTLRQTERSRLAFERRRARTESDIADHKTRKPGFWSVLRTFGEARRAWRERHAELARDRADTLDLLETAAYDHEQASAAMSAARSDVAEAQQALLDLDRSAAHDAEIVAEARSRWPDNVPGVDLSDEDFQRSAPWADTEIDGARADLFEAALRLHRAFLLAAAHQIRPALIAASKIIGGALHPEPAVARAAWQAFFMVVPVVSTTFASLPRLFADLGREDLGWLLVDEAGQATAQSVIGGLWRSRRAVLVGDPMQLEPIVPLPVSAQIALARRHGVDHQWLPDRRSAQLTADRLTAFGTVMRNPEGDDTIWVGSPLRVHRRCARPMFEIANEIAYENTMVFATRDRVSRAWPPSQWIDVQGAVGANVVEAELDHLSELVDELLAAGCGHAAILVITPFRAVVAAAQRRLSGLLSRRQVGTVHTVQGKEAPVVVLVLGGSTGARNWVAGRANLLNVAVSRAQERLYVIGDHADWRRRRFFASAARRLPVSMPGG